MFKRSAAPNFTVHPTATMLLSMTGFGAAAHADNETSATAEIKTVNNRYFKLSLRMSDGYAVLEPRIETLIRESIARGTVSLSLRIRKKRKAEYRIVTTVLQSYFKQLVDLGWNEASTSLNNLLTLPGVIETDAEQSDDELETVWNTVQQALDGALGKLQTMRQAEGESMAADLCANVEQLRTLIGGIEALAPNVAEQYRKRLEERVGKVLAEHGAVLDPVDLVREVAVYADRCDISEEIVRFRSHLAQFDEALKSKESCGRKLDFLTQELFRETNTIGSKANDAEMTKHVVDMKTVIERIREMVQNVE